MARKVVIDVEARFKDEVTDEAKAASDSVDKLHKKKARPNVDADTNRFIKKMREAEERAKSFGKKTASAVIDAKDKASAVFSKAMAKAKAYAGRTWSSIVAAKDKASSILSKITTLGKGIAGKKWSAIVKVKDYAMSPLTKIKNALFSIKTLAAAVFAGFAAKQAAKQLVMNPISVADSYSSAKIGFQTLLGEKQGQQMMDDLDVFAKATPFKTNEVIAQSQKMLAMGWNAEDILTDMGTIGDAAAATGKGEEGLQRIVLALSQIKSKGKLSTEELNQLSEAGISAKRYLAEGLGYGTGDAGLAAMTKDLEKGAIGADKAVQAILDGMKEYKGMMDKTANETVEGLWSQIQDTFEINVVRRWGQGLQDGAKRGLGSIVDLLDSADGALATLGDTIYDIGKSLSNWAADKLEKAVKTIKEVTNTSAFKNASLGGKIKILWDKVIAEPFEKWWNGSGKAKVAKIAGSVGKAMGTAITGGLLALLGITSEDALADGVSIGGSFVEGFLEGFDTEKITKALKEWASENKLLAGTIGTVIGVKILSGIGSAWTNIKGLIPGGKGGSGGVGGSSFATATMDVTAGVVNVYGLSSSGLGKGNLPSLPGTGGKTPALPGTGTGTPALPGAGAGAAGAAGAGAAKKAGLWTKFKNLFKGGKAADTATDVTKTLTKTDDAIDTAKLFGTGGKAAGTTSKFAKMFPKLSKGLSKAAPVLSVLDFALDGVFGYSKAKKEGSSTKEALGKGALKMVTGEYEESGAGNRTLNALGNTAKWAGAGALIGSAVPGLGTAVGGLVGGGIGLVSNLLGQGLDTGVIQDALDSIRTGWNSMWDSVGGFFTESVPAAAETVKEKVSTFFTETVPEAWNSLWDGVGSFFGEDIPYAIGFVVGKWDAFWGETWPAFWESVEEGWNSFWSETFPEFCDSVKEKWNTFWGETWPEYWDGVGEKWNSFWGETFPEFCAGVEDKWNTFWGETWPAFWDGVVEGWNTFWGETFPTFCDSVKEKWNTFWGESWPAFWDGVIEKWDAFWDGVGDFFDETLPAFKEKITTKWNGFWDGVVEKWNNFWDTAKESFNAGKAAGSGDGDGGKGKKARGGIVGGGSTALEAFARGGNTIEAFSNGGMAKGSTRFIRVNEEAPEMIIPLSSQRRDRAMKLWMKTGQLLDVPGFSRGGNTSRGNDEGIRFRQFGGSDEPAGGKSVVIEVGGIHVEIIVHGNDQQSIVEQIKQQAKEIAEVVAGELADALGGQFENTPARGGVA